MSRSPLVAVIFTLALVAAGCAEQSPEPVFQVDAGAGVSAAAALFAAGAEPSSLDHGGAVDREIEVVIADYSFEPSSIEVEAGESVRFLVANTGSFEHEFRLTNRHGADEHVDGGHEGHHDEAESATSEEVLLMVPPGTAKSLTLEFGDTTAFDVLACLIPGHFEAGMHADFTVRGAVLAMPDAGHHDDEEAHHDDEAAHHDDEEAHHDDGEMAHDDGEMAHDDGEMAHDDEEPGHDAGDGHHDDEGAMPGDGAAHHEDEEPGHDNSDGHHDDATAAGDYDRVVAVVVSDAGFDPGAIQVSRGETVRFQVVNVGSSDHEFRLTTRHSAGEGAAGGDHHHDEVVLLVHAGETGTLDVAIDDHAEFDVAACLLPGHYEAGEAADFVIAG